jgi:subtilisin family serine protease
MKSWFGLGVFFSFCVLGSSFSARAANIAVIDSGLDVGHEFLAGRIWVNPNPGNDGTGYPGDVNGWNFAENNNQLLDTKYLGTFSPDCTKFFDIQYRVLTGSATADDIAWYKAKAADEAFVRELGTFGNFVHGTHVSGISARDAAEARIMGVKLIPTEVKKSFEGIAGSARDRGVLGRLNPLTDYLIKAGLRALADQQVKLLVQVGEFVRAESMRVANCSFGTSLEQGKALIAALLKQVLLRDPTPEETATYSRYFLDQIVEKGKAFIAAAPDTLFVVAAGNDGTDNDSSPVSPANIKLENELTVAATWEHRQLAKFSNWGRTMVEVAAPGVGIRSSIPGSEYLRVSGTSQASPFVANLAGQVLDANPKLAPKEVKAVIVGTVDKKDFLADKVSSGGIANPARALEAARLSRTMPLAAAILAARPLVPDVIDRARTRPAGQELFILPLTPLFE